MRILTVLIFSMVLSISMDAQFSQGSWTLGGSAGFNSESYKADVDNAQKITFTNVWISPMAGYFIADQIAVGGEVSLSVNSSKYGDGESSSTSTFLLGPAARYYMPLNDDLAAFGHVDVKLEVTGGDDGYSYFGFGIGPGLAYFLTENVAVQGLLKVGFYSGESDPKIKETKIRLGIGFGIYLPN